MTNTDKAAELAEAIRGKYYPRVHQMLKDGYDLNETHKDVYPLSRAAFYGSTALIEALIKHGANIFKHNIRGNTALHAACYAGAPVENAAYLLDWGADINAFNLKGRMPLHVAYYHQNRAHIRLLLARGADADAQDNDGLEPRFAAAAGRKELNND